MVMSDPGDNHLPISSGIGTITSYGHPRKREKRNLLNVVDSQRESLVQRDGMYQASSIDFILDSCPSQQEENQGLRARQSELRAEIPKLQTDLAEAKSSEGAVKVRQFPIS